mgnify:FL=1
MQMRFFKDRKIDVLSCSTTFEMGVDVGDLQTVFMRNMPPSPSNYAQRAGRAGRSKASVAFALTFCNRANHDFHFFDDPIEMIRGDVIPPQLKVDNLKICIRHLYSCAFSYFFRSYPQFFSNAKQFFEGRNGGVSGYGALKEFLTNDSFERRALQNYLRQSVPLSLQGEFEIEHFGWVRWLFDRPREECPNLDLAKRRYESEIASLKKGLASGDGIGFRGRIRNLEQEPILSFLSRNDILPKYGFPVDTVELDASVRSVDYASLSNLNLTRDLSMAITEYAPGCQVVANGKLITSRYIQQAPGKDWRLYDYVLCQKCHTLNVCVHLPQEEWDNHPLKKCKQCGKELKQNSIKTFLVPEFGFVADKDVRRPTLVKPEKTHRMEVAFCSDKESEDETVYPIGQTEVKVSYVGDDGDMVLLNSTDFFVCPKCGYAIEAPGNVSAYKETLTEQHGHRNKNGYPCDGEILQRFSLGYRFKTDILRIRIKEPLLTPETMAEEAYSILQALILASERILGIGAGEIGGCLQYYYDGGPNFSYILFDKTPGGAGHVKVLNSQMMIQKLLAQAYRLAKGCHGCDEDSSCYGCLRTYENQSHHDEIKRSYVIRYFERVFR